MKTTRIKTEVKKSKNQSIIFKVSYELIKTMDETNRKAA